MLCRLLVSCIVPWGPGSQVAYLAYRLWPRTFIPCRNTGPRDNDTEVPRRGEHQPRRVLSPLYTLGDDSKTSKRRLRGHSFEAEFKIHVLGSQQILSSLEIRWSLIRPTVRMMPLLYLFIRTNYTNFLCTIAEIGGTVKSAQWRGLMTYV
jgi:hypothetical protein